MRTTRWHVLNARSANNTSVNFHRIIGEREIQAEVNFPVRTTTEEERKKS